MTDTQSPPSAIPNGETERAYHNTKAAYTLPNDNAEHSRLETQSQRLRDLMGNKLVHAQIERNSTQKALDIGCGTGVVTHELATLFPNAQVYGVDLSPVPDVRGKLPNITYIQGNINELADSQDPNSHFQAATFGYIFSRLLVLGMTGWNDYVERCVSLLKLGGWLEMHDLDMSIHRIPHSITATQHKTLRPHNLPVDQVRSTADPTHAFLSRPQWQITLDKLLNAKGLDPTCGSRLPGLFVDAGLQDVQVRRYLYPLSVWEGSTEAEKRCAEHHKGTMGNELPMMLKKLGTGSHLVGDVELQSAIQGAEAERDEWERSRGFIWLYVVSGRKAG